MRAPVIRISIGRFDAALAGQVEAKPRASKALLEPGIRALKGNLGYVVGVDRANNAMHNVSLWETVPDAEQMDHFAPMKKLAVEFIALGVVFERPIMNCDTLWQFE